MAFHLPTWSSAASHFNRWSVCRPFILLMAIVAMVRPATAQLCAFWEGSCIDPLAQTAVPLDFRPLFPDGVTLFYGFDARSGKSGQDPMIKTSFWLEYGNTCMDNSSVTANRTSEIALRVGNLTGTPSGHNNGCDGVWGAECSGDLKAALRHAIFELSISGHDYTNPLETVLDDMILSSSSLYSCPKSLWDVQSIAVDAFAQETMPQQKVTIQSGGDSQNPWKTWYIDNMTPSQQAEQVAVGILSRGPTFEGQPPSSEDEIQIELVCLQAPSSRRRSSSEPPPSFPNPDDGDDD